MNRFAIIAAGLVVSAGAALAGEKGLMHCFAYTVVDKATSTEVAAFETATDALPEKVKGLKRVWRGKLARPLTQYGVQNADDALRKKFTESGQATADVRMMRRQSGVCMEFESEAAFKAYGADPAHAEWEAAYGRIRVPGTTTYQILAQ
ncbi:MAG: hypothetical protein H7Y20_10430 [Bryobacteraceae bacterium]|nr:hypothetical protein [Bryobacteraceae bacterium]